MKRLTVIVAIALVMFFGAGSPALPQDVTLLHVNDSHSHLAAWGPKDAALDGTLGGLPKAAEIVAEERTVDPHALFVHAGDFMDGDLFYNQYLGVAELQLLQSIGLDALVLGNHEFAFGPVFLKSVLNAAWPGGNGGAPILGTNLNLTGYPSLAPWIRTTLLKSVNGVSVGFFGLTTPTGALARPAPVVIDSTLAADASAAVTALRGAGAQAVVCVSHLGLDAARELAGAVAGIDVIVNGHDHAVLEQPEAVERPGGGTTLIVSAGSRYQWVGRLRLHVSGNQVTFVDYVLREADANTPALEAVQSAVDALKAAIVTRYGDVYHLQLAWAAQDIANQFDPSKAKRDTPLGNLLADAYRERTGTDVAMEATGFIGDALPRGPIVGADVFRAMSYGMPAGSIVRPYRLVTFRTTGAGLLGALQTTIGIGGDYFPQVSGLRLQYDSRLAPGQQVLPTTVMVGEDVLVPDRLYSVTVTEGVFSALKQLMPVQDAVTRDDLAFDATRALVAARGELGPEASNRIRDVGAVPGHRR
jgi:2',3'-cyclic-nucleotide 2'-phosphodiesterase (5'-nucleotidase family)